MDAISFVLGVRSAQLRSTQLKDLIYRAGVRDDPARENGHEQSDPEEDANHQEAAKKAWVQAVYRDKKGKEWSYRRT
jgi:structural maintenance of chromosome 1